MTPDQVKRWSQLHGYTEEQAELDLRLWNDINKKASAPTETKDCVPNFSIEQIGW